jgi:hypothetical protein
VVVSLAVLGLVIDTGLALAVPAARLDVAVEVIAAAPRPLAEGVQSSAGGFVAGLVALGPKEDPCYKPDHGNPDQGHNGQLDPLPVSAGHMWKSSGPFSLFYTYEQYNSARRKKERLKKGYINLRNA